MSDKLPTRLTNSPLVDAIFECRLKASLPLANVLPGIIFKSFDGDNQLDRLPQADLPEIVRINDINLKYAPLVRIRKKDYSFLIGDHSIAISCTLPYKGWASFKLTIIKLINLLKETGFIEHIERYSIKYVDLIRTDDHAKQVSLANLSLRIGQHVLSNELYQARMHIPIDGFICILQILSGAQATIEDNKTVGGFIIDVDTIKELDNIPIDQLDNELESALEHIHHVSKKTFFECLTEEAIQQLGPDYD